MAGGPLAGRTVVVTRAAEQAGRLRALLEAAGAEVLEVPVVRIVEPADGGAALRAAIARLSTYDWLVVTSRNGVDAVVKAAGDAVCTIATAVAAVGPGTAEALAGAGLVPALVPERFVAEGLLEVFPAAPAGGGRVLLAQAERARPVLADGLRAQGWEVEAVVAYRTAPAIPSPELLADAARADAVTFTAGSGVVAYLEATGRAPVPPVVVCIGPVTATVAEEHGVRVTRVADPHDLPGLVAATVAALADGAPPVRSRRLRAPEEL